MATSTPAAAASAPMDGVGTSTFYGFSPALDLQATIDVDEKKKPEGEASASGSESPSVEVQSEVEQSESGPLKILLTYSSDLRHVLKTLAHCGKHPKRPIHFYLLEKKVENLARHLLFLSLIFDPDEITRREQVELFLEIYGNAMLREKTEEFVASRIKRLSRLITNQEGVLAPIVDFSLLKMKTKDELENVIRAWAPNIPFDAQKLRDQRLRQYYTDRYDFRANVVDWDYHMKLHGLAGIVHERHYKIWRSSGQAFTIDDTAYPKPNRTLASETEGKLKGSSVLVRGFWCDIVNSPYLTFGISADDETLFEKSSEKYKKTACDVAEYNLSKYLQEILDKDPQERPEFKIFLGTGEPDALYGKNAFKNTFSVAYFSNMAVHFLKPAFVGILRTNAKVICETARYMLDLRAEHKRQYTIRVYSLGLSLGLRLVSESGEEEVEVNPESGRIKEGEESTHSEASKPAADSIKKKIVLPQENTMARLVFRLERTVSGSK